jgi:LuxR family transcriptional regulator, maltose regulon positive regulatory protein
VAQALTAPVSLPDSPALPTAPALAGRRPMGVETGLLQLKIRPAPLRPGLVHRERLVRRLLDAQDLPVALIVAPSGYGKTTVLSQWSERDERPFAWVSLDAEDNDPTRLLSAIALALDAVEPIGWEVFEALTSERPDAASVALARLARSLGRRQAPLVLALDNLHVLRTRESRQVVTAIWQAFGAGLQLALASRSDAVLPVGRLRAHGNTVELRAEDLAMTRSEASMLLQLAGIELASEQVLTLARRTEGWPVGLHLAALSLRAQGRDRPRVEEFAGDDRFVAEYVREELLSGLAPAQLEFLTRTSVLDRLSAPVCDAVLGRHDSADMLTRLSRSNALLAPLDRRDSSYRYHELFAKVLQAEFRRLEPGRDAEVHRRASEWWAEHGDSERAIGHAIDGRDVQRAGRLLWDSAIHYAASGRHAVIWAWLDRFSPGELADTPLLALVAAGTSLAEGNLHEAEGWTALAAGAPGGTHVVQAGVALMHAGIGRRGVSAMGASAARAYQLLDEHSPWRPLCRHLQGVALHLTGERDEALDHLQEGAHRAAASAPMVQALCLAQLALLAAEGDDLERATTLAERATAQARRCGLAECPMAALPFAVSASLRAQRGQVAEATTEIRHALGLLTRITEPSPWYDAQCRIVLARATLTLNGLAAAGELLGEAARALARAPGAPVLHDWLDEAIAQVDLALSSTAGADWSLTTAELRVLRFMPSHLSFREIADRLYVSPNTVKTHARGIYRKLGVSSRANAVDRACGAGLVDPGLGVEAPASQ